jgi:hypothetical protein
MSKNTFYVLDHESVLVGPMSESDADNVAREIDCMGGGYNIFVREPTNAEVPNNGTLPLGDWVATHCT